MGGCLLVMLSLLFFIVMLILALAILFKYGGLAFLAFAIIASCISGAMANYILEKRDKDEL